MEEITLFLIKPDAADRAREIESAIGALLGAERVRAEVVLREVATLSPDQVRELYRAVLPRLSEEYAGELVRHMTSGPVVALLLRGRDVVAACRGAVGATDPRRAAPGTLRARFGDQAEGAPVFRNAVHASESAEEASRETFALFPDAWAALF